MPYTDRMRSTSKACPMRSPGLNSIYEPFDCMSSFGGEAKPRGLPEETILNLITPYAGFCVKRLLTLTVPLDEFMRVTTSLSRECDNAISTLTAGSVVAHDPKLSNAARKERAFM